MPVKKWFHKTATSTTTTADILASTGGLGQSEDLQQSQVDPRRRATRQQSQSGNNNNKLLAKHFAEKEQAPYSSRDPLAEDDDEDDSIDTFDLLPSISSYDEDSGDDEEDGNKKHKTRKPLFEEHLYKCDSSDEDDQSDSMEMLSLDGQQMAKNFLLGSDSFRVADHEDPGDSSGSDDDDETQRIEAFMRDKTTTTSAGEATKASTTVTAATTSSSTALTQTDDMDILGESTRSSSSLMKSRAGNLLARVSLRRHTTQQQDGIFLEESSHHTAANAGNEESTTTLNSRSFPFKRASAGLVTVKAATSTTTTTNLTVNPLLADNNNDDQSPTLDGNSKMKELLGNAPLLDVSKKSNSDNDSDSSSDGIKEYRRSASMSSQEDDDDKFKQEYMKAFSEGAVPTSPPSSSSGSSVESNLSGRSRSSNRSQTSPVPTSSENDQALSPTQQLASTDVNDKDVGSSAGHEEDVSESELSLELGDSWGNEGSENGKQSPSKSFSFVSPLKVLRRVSHKGKELIQSAIDNLEEETTERGEDKLTEPITHTVESPLNVTSPSASRDADESQTNSDDEKPQHDLGENVRDRNTEEEIWMQEETSSSRLTELLSTTEEQADCGVLDPREKAATLLQQDGSSMDESSESNSSEASDSPSLNEMEEDYESSQEASSQSNMDMLKPAAFVREDELSTSKALHDKVIAMVYSEQEEELRMPLPNGQVQTMVPVRDDMSESSRLQSLPTAEPLLDESVNLKLDVDRQRAALALQRAGISIEPDEIDFDGSHHNMNYAHDEDEPSHSDATSHYSGPSRRTALPLTLEDKQIDEDEATDDQLEKNKIGLARQKAALALQRAGVSIEPDEIDFAGGQGNVNRAYSDEEDDSQSRQARSQSSVASASRDSFETKDDPIADKKIDVARQRAALALQKAGISIEPDEVDFDGSRHDDGYSDSQSESQDENSHRDTQEERSSLSHGEEQIDSDIDVDNQVDIDRQRSILSQKPGTSMVHSDSEEDYSDGSTCSEFLDQCVLQKADSAGVMQYDSHDSGGKVETECQEKELALLDTYDNIESFQEDSDGSQFQVEQEQPPDSLTDKHELKTQETVGDGARPGPLRDLSPVDGMRLQTSTDSVFDESTMYLDKDSKDANEFFYEMKKESTASQRLRKNAQEINSSPPTSNAQIVDIHATRPRARALDDFVDSDDDEMPFSARRLSLSFRHILTEKVVVQDTHAGSSTHQRQPCGISVSDTHVNEHLKKTSNEEQAVSASQSENSMNANKFGSDGHSDGAAKKGLVGLLSGFKSLGSSFGGLVVDNVVAATKESKSENTVADDTQIAAQRDVHSLSVDECTPSNRLEEPRSSSEYELAKSEQIERESHFDQSSYQSEDDSDYEEELERITRLAQQQLDHGLEIGSLGSLTDNRISADGHAPVDSVHTEADDNESRTEGSDIRQMKGFEAEDESKDNSAKHALFPAKENDANKVADTSYGSDSDWSGSYETDSDCSDDASDSEESEEEEEEEERIPGLLVVKEAPLLRLENVTSKTRSVTGTDMSRKPQNAAAWGLFGWKKPTPTKPGSLNMVSPPSTTPTPGIDLTAQKIPSSVVSDEKEIFEKKKRRRKRRTPEQLLASQSQSSQQGLIEHAGGESDDDYKVASVDMAEKVVPTLELRSLPGSSVSPAAPRRSTATTSPTPVVDNFPAHHSPQQSVRSSSINKNSTKKRKTKKEKKKKKESGMSLKGHLSKTTRRVNQYGDEVSVGASVLSSARDKTQMIVLNNAAIFDDPDDEELSKKPWQDVISQPKTRRSSSGNFRRRTPRTKSTAIHSLSSYSGLSEGMSVIDEIKAVENVIELNRDFSAADFDYTDGSNNGDGDQKGVAVPFEQLEKPEVQPLTLMSLMERDDEEEEEKSQEGQSQSDQAESKSDEDLKDDELTDIVHLTELEAKLAEYDVDFDEMWETVSCDFSVVQEYEIRKRFKERKKVKREMQRQKAKEEKHKNTTPRLRLFEKKKSDKTGRRDLHSKRESKLTDEFLSAIHRVFDEDDIIEQSFSEEDEAALHETDESVHGNGSVKSLYLPAGNLVDAYLDDNDEEESKSSIHHNSKNGSARSSNSRGSGSSRLSTSNHKQKRNGRTGSRATIHGSRKKSHARAPIIDPAIIFEAELRRQKQSKVVTIKGLKQEMSDRRGTSVELLKKEFVDRKKSSVAAHLGNGGDSRSLRKNKADTDGFGVFAHGFGNDDLFSSSQKDDKSDFFGEKGSHGSSQDSKKTLRKGNLKRHLSRWDAMDGTITSLDDLKTVHQSPTAPIGIFGAALAGTTAFAGTAMAAMPDMPNLQLNVPDINISMQLPSLHMPSMPSVHLPGKRMHSNASANKSVSDLPSLSPRKSPKHQDLARKSKPDKNDIDFGAAFSDMPLTTIAEKEGIDNENALGLLSSRDVDVAWDDDDGEIMMSPHQPGGGLSLRFTKANFRISALSGMKAPNVKFKLPKLPKRTSGGFHGASLM